MTEIDIEELKVRVKDFAKKMGEEFDKEFPNIEVLPVRWIAHFSTYDKATDTTSGGIVGNGCPMCVIEELVSYALINNIRHAGDESKPAETLEEVVNFIQGITTAARDKAIADNLEERIKGVEIPKNLMN